MLAFVDHGAGGTGERPAAMLRPGRANASDAADQIAVLDAALAQLPESVRPRVLVCGDTGSGARSSSGTSTTWACPTRMVSTVANRCSTPLAARPRQAWRRALDTDGRAREGAQVAELTRWLPATFLGWPPGMREIARRERPHPGAQLRITDATWLAHHLVRHQHHRWLAVRHRMRARAEDRIRTLKDTGLTNLPLQEFAKNEIWLELAALAYELMTWTQLLDWPDHPARSWEPKRLRLRLLSVAVRIITTGRRRILRLNRRWPWSELLISGQRNIATFN